MSGAFGVAERQGRLYDVLASPSLGPVERHDLLVQRLPRYPGGARAGRARAVWGSSNFLRAKAATAGFATLFQKAEVNKVAPEIRAAIRQIFESLPA